LYLVIIEEAAKSPICTWIYILSSITRVSNEIRLDIKLLIIFLIGILLVFIFLTTQETSTIWYAQLLNIQIMSERVIVVKQFINYVKFTFGLFVEFMLVNR